MDWCEKAIVPAGHCSGPGGVAAFQRRGMASDPLSGSRGGCAVLWLMLQDLGFPFDADEALEAEGSWGTTNTSLTTMARLRLCRTATEQAFQRGTLEDSSLVF